MFDVVFVTNRKLCKENFFARLEKLAKASPSAIILREKDLQEDEYENLATCAFEACAKHNTFCILHGFSEIAIKLGAPALHLPLDKLRALPEAERRRFKVLGASCHSVEDALEAERLGCTYITAGHIFETDCKKGVPARGIDFLREVCRAVSLPVYAIGGVCAENIRDVMNVGARGACVMSGAMLCDDPSGYRTKLKGALYEI